MPYRPPQAFLLAVLLLPALLAWSACQSPDVDPAGRSVLAVTDADTLTITRGEDCAAVSPLDFAVDAGGTIVFINRTSSILSIRFGDPEACPFGPIPVPRGTATLQISDTLGAKSCAYDLLRGVTPYQCDAVEEAPAPSIRIR